MKIAVLGFGNVGSQLGKLWAKTGHEVTAGLREESKDRQKASDAGVSVATPADAVKNADVVVIALPWHGGGVDAEDDVAGWKGCDGCVESDRGLI